MHPIDVVEAAKHTLTPEKWTKGMYLREDGTMCFVGVFAYLEARLYNRPLHDEGSIYEDEFFEAIMACGQVVREQYPDRIMTVEADADEEEVVIVFNDHAATTLGDVHAVLEKAAVRLAEKV